MKLPSLMEAFEKKHIQETVGTTGYNIPLLLVQPDCCTM